ncbi:MAG: hypothetical protein ACPLIG_05095 [Candidatus Bathyarchaeales archaeon]
MFGKNKRLIRDVTFVQPVKGDAYFCTPIAYAVEHNGSKVFRDSDLALAGKLKLIFEREKMTWMEIKEEKAGSEHYFALYYYPKRLVSERNPCSEEKATLAEVKRLFDFFITHQLDRPADVARPKSPSAYGSSEKEVNVEIQVIPVEAAVQ